MAGKRNKLGEPEMPVLEKFAGREVLGTNIAVTNAGDGLSQAMETDPTLLNLGERVYLVIETTVARVAYVDDPKHEGGLIRTHTLRAGAATIVDYDLVADVIVKQKDKNQILSDRKKGVTRLPMDEDADGFS